MQGIFNLINDFTDFIISVFKLIGSGFSLIFTYCSTALNAFDNFLLSDVPVVPREIALIIVISVVLSIILKIFGRSLNNDP